MRKPRVYFRLAGRRTALTVCHAINMAMTVVFPAPVANLKASRINSGFASRFESSRCCRNFAPLTPICGATSVSQSAVSIASNWQKNGRIPENGCCRQCCRSLAVSGVTFQSAGFLRLRQMSTSARTPLMMAE